MTEQRNPVLDLESQTTATAIDDDNLTSTMAAPALSSSPPPLRLPHPPGVVRRRAYQFDGFGNFEDKEWDIAEGTDNKFCWYHLQIDPHYVQPDAYAHILIDSFCPPLKLLDIISLVNDGPFCSSSMDDGILIFRIHSRGHVNGDFPFRVAARVSQNSLITVSLGDVPRLHYNKHVSGGNPLFKVPQLEFKQTPIQRNGIYELHNYYISTKKFVDGQPVDEQHDLVDLFSEARRLQPDCTVPITMASLVVHVIDTHVDLIHERIANIVNELNSVEENWDDGNFEHNKKLMDGIKFSEMQLTVQRILQVIAETEQLLHQVKNECGNFDWLNVLTVPDGHSLGKTQYLKVFAEIEQALRLVRDECRCIDWFNLFPPDLGCSLGPEALREKVIDQVYGELTRMGDSKSYEYEKYRIYSTLREECCKTNWREVTDGSSLEEICPKVTARIEQLLDHIDWLNVFGIVDDSSLQEILDRPKVLRENAMIVTNRIAATQARVAAIQSERFNRRVFIISIFSMIFLPLSLITGVFSMQVSGVPWTGQNHPEGFRNVAVLGIATALGILMIYLSITAIYHRVAVRRRQKKGPNEKGSKLFRNVENV